MIKHTDKKTGVLPFEHDDAPCEVYFHEEGGGGHEHEQCLDLRHTQYTLVDAGGGVDPSPLHHYHQHYCYHRQADAADGDDDEDGEVGVESPEEEEFQLPGQGADEEEEVVPKRMRKKRRTVGVDLSA